MKALEKDRSRRYETANGLAMDVQRYLADEAVQACPPSAGYRLRKFARRNKGSLAVAALVLLLLVVVGSGVGWVVRDRAARQAKLTADFELALDRAEQLQGQGKRGESLASIERAEQLAGESLPTAVALRRLAEVRASLDAQQRDEAFVSRFDEIRLADQTEVDPARNTFAMDRALPRIGEALQEYGFEIGVTPPHEVAAQVLSRPRPVQGHLLAALDEYLRLTPAAEKESRRWLVSVLDVADGDAWRVQARQAPDKSPELLRLVKEVDIKRQPPAFLIIVAQRLPAGPDRLDLYRRLQRAHPDDFWANHRLAIELRRHQRFAEAVRYDTAALALRPSNPGVYLNRALNLESLKEPGAALQDLERATELAPRYAMAWRVKGRLLQKMNDGAGAVQAYRRAVDCNREDHAALLQLAYVLLMTSPNDYTEAVAHYKAYLRLKPNDFEARFRWGELLEQLDRRGDVIAEYREAVRLARKNPETPFLNEMYHRLSGLLRYERQWEESVATAEEASGVFPNVPWHLSGVVHGRAMSPLAKLRDPERMLEAARRIVQLVKKQTDKSLGESCMGVAQYRAGQWKAAIETLTAMNERNPPTRGGCYHLFFLAMAHWQVGQKTEARNAYQRGLEEYELCMKDIERMQRSKEVPGYMVRNSVDGLEGVRLLRDEAAALLRIQHKPGMEPGRK
jgi:tetratricopeptide (TPR) repeat protein